MHLATAGGSGAAARTALAPLERIKVYTMLLRAGQHTGVLHILTSIMLYADLAASRSCESFAIHAEVWITAQRLAQHP